MRNIILKRFEDKDYVLIARVKEDDTVYEYVAAWHYDQSSKSWGQGHYFSDLQSALDYISNR